MLGHELLHRSVAIHRPSQVFPSKSFSADRFSSDPASSFFSRQFSSSNVRNRAVSDTVSRVVRKQVASHIVVSDNPVLSKIEGGTELTSHVVVARCHDTGVEAYHRAGKAAGECFRESFNGRLRDECLNDTCSRRWLRPDGSSRHGGRNIALCVRTAASAAWRSPILNLHRQGLKVAAIVRQVGVDRKTVRKYIARGLEPPRYGPRQPRSRAIDKHVAYLRVRLVEYPGLTAQWLHREIAGLGYAGGYSMVRDEVRALRPAGGGKGYAVRFETLPGEQAQVDFAQFRVSFTDEPDVVHIVWLFSIVLGYSRLIWDRFAHRQTMQTVLACHKAAFEAFGGVPRQILYDRLKTAVIGEDADGQVVYNRTLGELAHHYGFLLKACHPYRPETKGKVERPFRYTLPAFSGDLVALRPLDIYEAVGRRLATVGAA